MLGPLELWRGEEQIALGPPQQRRALAMLISRVGEPVSTRALVEAVWDGSAPPSAAKTLQGYIVRLRQALATPGDTAGPRAAIVTSAAGYRLDAAPEAVDALRFTALLNRAREAAAATDWRSARASVDEALALWRGPAYAEFADREFAAAEAARLEQLKLVAYETRFEIGLAVGEGSALVPELEKAVAEQPTRERLWELLIRALYRAGRQSDALSAYLRARRSLAEELGVEPGPGLQAVHAAVLAQDPGLDTGPTGGIDAAGQLVPAGAHPFQGRDREMAWLRERWRHTIEGGGSVAVISGPSGIGTTRLLAAFADEVQRGGYLVVRRSGVAAPNPSTVAALSRDRPVLLVLDGPLTGLDPHSVSPLRMLIVVGVDPAGTPRHVLDSLVSAEWWELEPLAHEICAGIARRWAPDDPGIDVDAVVARARGNPGRAHQLMAEIIAESSRQRIHQSVAQLVAARADITAWRGELAQGVRELRRGQVMSAAASAGHRDPVAGEPCPYRGLEPYGTDDAALFYGRDKVVEQLVARIADTAVVTVLGASGTGKSSLVRAGLLPALANGCLPGSGSWPQFVVTPADAVPAPHTSPAVIVVDQFEQAWVVRDDAARDGYVDAILALADAGHRVVLTLRADHIDRCTAHARLRAVVAEGTLLLGPMSTTELAQVIVGPAEVTGCEAEPALVERILDDVRGLAAPLPLLSTALTETWQQDRGLTLSVRSYLSRGGVAGSLARRAEATFGALSSIEQVAARRVLVRLATGERGAMVGRRCPYPEAAYDEPGRRAVDALAKARLITVDATGVEVAHEALFNNWPRLANWLDEDEQGRRLRAHLAPAAAEWDRTGRSDADLYRGLRLNAADAWAADHPTDLSPVEDAFLTASSAHAERELQAERARTARDALVRRRLTYLLTAVAATAIVAIAATIVALTQRANADRQRHAATSQALLALARQLGAASLANQPVDHSLLLAVSAVRVDNSINTRSDLLAALQRSPAVRTIWHGDGSPLYGLALSDHDRIAMAPAPDGITTWTLSRSRTPDLEWQFQNAFTPVLAARPGSDEVALANVSYPDEIPLIKLWDPVRGQQIGNDLTGATSRISSLAWSPDGRYLAAAQDVGDVLVWDLKRPNAAPGHVERLRPHSSPGAGGFPLIFPAVAYAGPNTYAVVEGNGFGQVSRVGVAHPLRTFTPGADDSAVSGSPDGTELAIGHDNGGVTLFTLPDLRPLSPVTSHPAAVDAITFSADGHLIATMGADEAVNVTNLSTGQLLAHLTGHTAQINAAEFAADNRRLFTSSSDGTVISWDIANLNDLGTKLSTPTPRTRVFTENVVTSRTGALAVQYSDGTIRIWGAPDAPRTAPFSLAIPNPRAAVSHPTATCSSSLMRPVPSASSTCRHAASSRPSRTCPMAPSIPNSARMPAT